MPANFGALAPAQLGACLVFVVVGADPPHVLRLVFATAHEWFDVVYLPAWARAARFSGGGAWIEFDKARTLGFVARQGDGADSAQAQHQCCQRSVKFLPGAQVPNALRCCAAAGDLIGTSTVLAQARQALWRESIRHRL